MIDKKVVAFVLAGGKGTRLGSLTKKNAKPAVWYGGKYRIIDFVLSNVAISNISSVAIATQYESVELVNYTSNGQFWGFNGINSEFSILSPRQKEEGQSWYDGTADAVFKNLDFLDSRKPDYVLILSADHIYRMDYQKLIAFHEENKADCTICTIEVPLEDRSRFGMVNFDEKRRLIEFEEKPRQTKLKEASMGVYVFNYKVLRDELIKDSKDEKSSHDFGKNIIPHLLNAKKKVYCYLFNGYWRDVGTIESLWKANLDLINTKEAQELFGENENTRVMSQDNRSLPQYIGPNARVTSSLINQGSVIFGRVDNSVIFSNVVIEEGAIIQDSVLMPNCHIGKNARIYKALVASDVTIEEDREVNKEQEKVVLINS
ncbi:MAG: glucose-1-phosphate adenylyltransferase [Bacillales bacterium]|nr:glucose-1-phosphate adenylyltransferase [Bacillales bacterium]MDD7381460.1 glucose-1-phosphate adenylyltransferase [Bacillales bacterium]